MTRQARGVPRAAGATALAVAGWALGAGAPYHAAQVRHPNEAAVLRPDIPVRRIDADPLPAGSRFRAVADRLMRYEAVASVGVFDGPAAEVFGKIEDVTFGSDGHIYVLDSQAKELRVFDRTGALVRRGGRAGEGPGEFMHPLSVAVAEDGRVYVGEVEHTIEVLEPSVDGFASVGQLHPDVAARDLCVLADAVLVHGHHVQTNRVFHRYSLEGELQARFGEVYGPEPVLLTHQIAVGRIRCPGRGDLVAFAPASQLPDVRGYGLDGAARWLSLLPDYRPTIIEVTAGGGYSARMPEDGWNGLFSITAPVRGYLLVQVSYITGRGAEEGAAFTRLESYVFDAETGDGGYVGDGLPPIIEADDRCYVTAREVPFPRLGILCREGGAAGSDARVLSNATPAIELDPTE